MSWTPHSREYLENRGVDMSAADTATNGSVVIWPSGSNSGYGSSAGSSVSAMAASGVPLTGGNSGYYVDQNAIDLGSLAGTGFNFDKLFQLIRQNTQENNAWSAEQAQKQMDFQTQSNQIAMDFNAAEAAKNRDWQEMMSNTAHQREIADLKAAGLNPVLSATGGNGAAVTSGATAQGVSSSGAKADADQSANGAMASVYGALVNAQTSMYNANLSAQTNLKMAEMQQAASMYGAQLAAQVQYASQQNQMAMLQEQLNWNAEHPTNPYSLAVSLFGGESGVSGAKQTVANSGDMMAPVLAKLQNTKWYNTLKHWNDLALGKVKSKYSSR